MGLNCISPYSGAVVLNITPAPRSPLESQHRCWVGYHPHPLLPQLQSQQWRWVGYYLQVHTTLSQLISQRDRWVGFQIASQYFHIPLLFP